MLVYVGLAAFVLLADRTAYLLRKHSSRRARTEPVVESFRQPGN